jgi:hypothetical protein
MILQSQSFALAIALAAAAVTAAPGASGSATGGPAIGGSEGTESIPDFSGIWVHSLPGFEPPASGATALVNRSRRPNGTGDILKLAGDYTNPILKAEAAEVGGVPFVFTNGPTQLLQEPDRVIFLYGYDHQLRHVLLCVSCKSIFDGF